MPRPCLRFRLVALPAAVPVLLAVSVLLAGVAGIPPARAESSTDVREAFASPSRDYSTGPLWVWNDLLTEGQIRSTLRDLAGQGVRQAWVHPRPGLMTPYLGPDWFRLWRIALDEAARLDMNIWIYDENSYPSGFAGGLVPEALPGSRGQGLHLVERKVPEGLDDDVLALYRIEEDACVLVMDELRAGRALPAGRYLVGLRAWAGSSPWFAGTWYVDLLRPGVTERFVEITLDAYRREIGHEFGGRVPGVFTDEPHLAPAGGLHWSDDLPRLFRERWGYDLLDHLPALVRPVGDWRQVRHDYWRLLLERFIDRWARPVHDYCERHGLEFTGHYWEHGWPGAGHGGDNMAMYAWHQRPAIDNLMNEYAEGTHAQFGNARTVRELASVANQLGRRRTLCEAYGAGGWDLRFEDMKRIGDWLYVLGVNTLNEHLSYVTIRGARKRDHPQSFSYHAPWWDSYHVMARYFTRLSLALSSGEQVHEILVLEPTTTTWMYQMDPGSRGRLYEVGNAFQDLVNALERAQVEYDIGCEDIMGRHGGVDEGRLRVGRRSYRTLVLPPHTENLDATTWALVERFVATGGLVLCAGSPPDRVDGRSSDAPARLAAHEGWRRAEVAELPDLLRERMGNRIRIDRDEGDRGILFHHRRQLDDGDLLFLVNTSISAPSSGRVVARAGGVEEWDPSTGEVGPCPFLTSEGLLSVPFRLPPCGSRLLFISREARDPGPPPGRVLKTIPSRAPPVLRRLAPNVLPIDYVDVVVGEERREGLHFYRASRLVWERHGLPGNPWDSAVQSHDHLIRRTFPADSGFEATYRFEVDEGATRSLSIAVERPDLYSITCNDRAVAPTPGEWWLDRSFGIVDLSDAVRPGENRVTLRARPMTMFHELEPAYLLGDFSLEATESGHRVVASRPLEIGRRTLHSSAPDGSMWLSCGIGFQSGGRAVGRDASPWVEFDLGDRVDLAAVDVWNYNETRLTSRGVDRLRIRVSATGEESSYSTIEDALRVPEAPGAETTTDGFPRRLSLDAPGVRYVRLEVLSNHAGVSYPAGEDAVDNAFVGLSEVVFSGRGKDGGLVRIPGVTVRRVSSELSVGFDRRAEYLVDGRGLARGGWSSQGHPFYGHSVAYSEEFDLGRLEGRYRVVLPSWHGSVAQVRVNGEPAGAIAWRPWNLDVTDRLVPGRNRIEVEVVGTLRNPLGPHHAGPVLGRAWPTMFRQAPETGPPPGRAYHTVGYGLFEPFELQRVEVPSAPPEGPGSERGPAWRPLYRGVDYAPARASSPRPLRVHALRIRLDDPGVDFVVTSSNGDRPLETDGLRTSTFLERAGCQLAINASPFRPIVLTEGTPQDVLGLCVSDAEVISASEDGYAALIIDSDRKARVAAAPVDPRGAHDAVGGFGLLLRAGVNVGSDGKRHPRTAAGVSRDGRVLYLCVIDGRQSGYSEGTTTRETAEWMRWLGAHDAINLDGGGSTTMVREGPGGGSVLVNRPIHAGVPGLERVNANHLGLRARALGDP